MSFDQQRVVFLTSKEAREIGQDYMEQNGAPAELALPCPTCSAGRGNWCGHRTSSGRWRSYADTTLPMCGYFHKARQQLVGVWEKNKREDQRFKRLLEE